MAQNSFETVFANSIAGFFLREFCFSNTEFSPPNGTEVELADFVIRLEDLVIVFQVKSRQAPSADPERERRWFDDKVVARATRQVRDTVTYLQTCAPEIANDRGRRVALAGVDVSSIVKIVIFDGGSELPLDCVRRRFHESKSAGFIHLIAAVDWHSIMETLVTPREIVDYLHMRERLSLANAAEARAVSEKALMGQFIADAANMPVSNTFERVLDRMFDNSASFDMRQLLSLFGDRITSVPPAGTQTPHDLREASSDYYPIVLEIAKLPRTDLAVFKERFDLAWERAGRTFLPPFMRMVSSTGMGFVFAPVPSGMEAQAQNGLANFVAAHMYEQRITRCIGAAFIHEGPKQRFIFWMMTERGWHYDAEMEMFLQEKPIGAVRETMVPRYRIVDRPEADRD